MRQRADAADRDIANARRRHAGLADQAEAQAGLNKRNRSNRHAFHRRAKRQTACRSIVEISRHERRDAQRRPHDDDLEIDAFFGKNSLGLAEIVWHEGQGFGRHREPDFLERLLLRVRVRLDTKQ